MKCSRCGNDVLTPASACPACGQPLQPDASTTQVHSATVSRLNASDIVLMFGDHFAEWKEEGYKVPCSQVEVGFSSLVVAMVTAALASLAGEGLVGVAKGQKKGFLFKSDVVVVSKQKEPTEAKEGVEGKILTSLTGDAQKDSLRDVVRRILGQSTMDPYTVILGQAMEHAHQAGFFVEDEKASPIVKFLAGKTVATPLSPLCDRITAVAGEVHKMQALLESFKSQNTDLCAVIAADIKKSINTAYIQS